MNNTVTTTTVNSLEVFYASFSNPLPVIRIYQIGYTCVFVFGFLGNLFSLLIFCRKILRRMSTGCLFIILALSDTLYLLINTIDYLEFGFSVQLYHRIDYDGLCRFRSFVMFVTQLLSPWILVIISVDRWIRARFPFKFASICTRKHVLIVLGIILTIDILIHSHMLTRYFGALIPGFANGACGPMLIYHDYLEFYYLVWSTIQIFTTCVIPSFLMLIILIDIFIRIRMRKRSVMPINLNQNQHKNIQNQMFILTLASIAIFFLTNLPVSISITVLSRGNTVRQDSSSRTTIVTALGWLRNFSYAIHFYIYCLTSRFFREEFQKQLHRLLYRFLRRTTRVRPILPQTIDR